MPVKKKIKDLKFEEAISKLEANVKLLESGDLSLEEALDVFKEGVELSQVCHAKLNNAQQEVQKVIATSDENYNYMPFGEVEE
ncbi:Exodeoxyribonuclease 7 small subunit [bioreactor metagenome]|uniref:Exodeoxyribonuclease 7 small subunit n=1 Tax=bioreactor metagenome TaxID=1076179 RepID=A0A645C2W8_9ZZZZ